jgi:DNA-binding NarL/FixJ family response regulator
MTAGRLDAILKVLEHETKRRLEQEEGLAMPQCIRVIIVDDRPRSRHGLRALLDMWRRVEVVGEADDGQQAVQLVEQCQPDVVLMDARMPVMDGLEATRLIKDKWPEVKVVVLTMYAGYRAEALAAGADAFLVKGCPEEELLGAILDYQGAGSNQSTKGEGSHGQQNHRTKRHRPTVIKEKKEGKSDEEETACQRHGARFAANQLWSTGRNTNAH